MKTIDYYVNLPYKLEIVPDLDEGGYIARYPATRLMNLYHWKNTLVSLS